MYVEPNTKIKVLSGVPVDPDHKNTLYFDTVAAQSSYFESKAAEAFYNYTYQRVSNGVGRISCPADRIYHCNYMMFQNAAYGSKWFYAFITSVEYVNDVTAEIRFTIDLLQTWLFEMRLGQCYIERTHTTTDRIGEHLEPEDIDTGEYKTIATQATGFFNNYVMVVLSAASLTGEPPSVEVWKSVCGGMPCGLYAYAFKPSDEGDYNTAFNLLTKFFDTDSIVSVFLFPEDLINVDDLRQIVTAEAVKKEIKPMQTTRPNTIDGYTPKNNKLFAYPYTLLRASTSYGPSVSLHYEYFKDGDPDFDLLAGFSANPTVLMVPHNYNGEIYAWGSALEISQFPQVAYISDTYRAWVAQGGLLSLASSAITGVGSATVGAMTKAASGAAGSAGLVVSSAVGLAMGAVSAMYEIERMKNAPDTGRGSCSATAQFCHRLVNYYFEVRQVRREYAEMIDDYFTMFGYAINQVGTPSLRARPHYTYVKTRGCIVKGKLPADAMQQISAAFDSGITWWRNPDEVGNYSLDNSPS